MPAGPPDLLTVQSDWWGLVRADQVDQSLAASTSDYSELKWSGMRQRQ